MVIGTSESGGRDRRPLRKRNAPGSLRKGASDAGQSEVTMPSTDEWRNFVPQPRLSMRKVKEVLRPHHKRELGQRQIRPLLLDLSGHRPRLLKAGRNAGLPWPLPPDCDDAQIEKRLFGGRVARPPGHRRTEPDYDSVPLSARGPAQLKRLKEAILTLERKARSQSKGRGCPPKRLRQPEAKTTQRKKKSAEG